MLHFNIIRAVGEKFNDSSSKLCVIILYGCFIDIGNPTQQHSYFLIHPLYYCYTGDILFLIK